MQKIHFKIFINAKVEKVWNTMLDDKTYRIWTSEFNPRGSWYEGSWDEGSKMKFIGPDEKGNQGGMIAIIDKNILHQFVSIKHIGMINNGTEDTESEEVKKWTPAFENYTFVEKDGGTELTIDMDSHEDYVEMFSGLWPKALNKLKQICEE